MAKEKITELGKKDVLELKFELEPTAPPIWRNVVVRDSISMYQLHEIIQVVMGWMHSHLFCFSADGVVIGVPSPDGDDFSPVEFKDAKRVKVRQFLEKPGDSVCYQYDFGDSWDHTITAVKRLDESELRYEVPRCIAGKNACPPEDCGGFPGFERLKEVISDPKHEEYDQLTEWLDEYYPDYDPREFSLSAVNKILKIGASKYLRLMPKLYGG
jgi:hypothetical protein